MIILDNAHIIIDLLLCRVLRFFHKLKLQPLLLHVQNAKIILKLLSVL